MRGGRGGRGLFRRRRHGCGVRRGRSPGAEATTGEWVRVGLDLANTRATDDESIGADDVADLAPAWALDGVTA